MSEDARPNRPPWRRWLARLIKVLVIGGILAYLVAAVLSHWTHAPEPGGRPIRVLIREANLTFLAAALFFHLFSMVFLGLLWRELMTAVGEPLGVFQAIRMQWLSSMGKYIPGKVGTTLGRIYLGGVERVSRRHVGLCCLYEILFCFAGSALTVLLCLLFGSLGRLRLVAVPCMALLVLTVACVHPRIMLPSVNWLLKKLRKDPIAEALSYPQTLLFAVGYMIPYVLSGASQFAILRAFFALDTRHMVDVTGVMTFAAAIGFAALFAPSGLGVRDGLLAKGLELLPAISAPGAALLALVGRLQSLLMDLFGTVCSLLLYGGRPRKGPPPASLEAE